MTRLFRSTMLLCMLPLSACMTAALNPQGHIAETSAVEASAAAAASRSADSATFAAWMAQIRRQLESKKRFPAAARARWEQGTVVVAFVLDRQGRLAGSRVARSSGFAALDSAALELVRQAQPFPAPPAELPSPRLNMTIPIRYQALPPCTFLNRLFQPCTTP
jgi:periplasmic protein TonB